MVDAPNSSFDTTNFPLALFKIRRRLSDCLMENLLGAAIMRKLNETDCGPALSLLDGTFSRVVRISKSRSPATLQLSAASNFPSNKRATANICASPLSLAHVDYHFAHRSRRPLTRFLSAPRGRTVNADTQMTQS